jgi:hypothetical protein
MTQLYFAFCGDTKIADGDLLTVALAAKARADAPVLMFEWATGAPFDLDLRGDAEAIAARLKDYVPPGLPQGRAPAEPRGRGRPKLGVAAREVTLLPRHWDWLAAQPGGASVALRKLVEAAMRDPAAARKQRQAAAYRVMSAIAGNRAGFLDATRALFADDLMAFRAATAAWRGDIAAQVEALLEA